MSPSTKSLSFDPIPSRRHENPAAALLGQSLSGRNTLKHTNVHFPAELHTRLQLHAVNGETTLRELIRTVIEQWVKVDAYDLEKIKRGEVEIPAVEDGRKNRGQRGESQTFGVFLSQEVHSRIKEVAALMGLTMRGIIVGIMQDWADAHCA